MNGGQVTGGPTSQAGGLQMEAVVPASPSIIERVNAQESRMDNKDNQFNALDRALTLLIQENRLFRDQLGLQPLPEDYFTS